MIYQEIVTAYSSVSCPGESHNNQRHTSLYATAFNGVDQLQPGIAQVVTGLYTPSNGRRHGAHTRLQIANPSIANLIAANEIVIVHNDRLRANNFVTNRIGQTQTTTTRDFDIDSLVRVAEDDEIYVIVEKAIDPTNPVFIRVANPDTSGNQGIGFFTDTADGTNTVEIDSSFITSLKWIGTDSFSFLNSLDSNITAEIDKRRMGMSTGFAIAPLRIRN